VADEPAKLDPAKNPCACVERHSPRPYLVDVHHVWPKSWGGPNIAENRTVLCPTAHVDVHVLLDAWRKAGARPKERPRSVNHRVWLVAISGWDAWDEAGRPD
jgi:hypothetical protein